MGVWVVWRVRAIAPDDVIRITPVPYLSNSIPGVTVLNVWFAHFDKVVTPVCVNAGRRNNISCCGRVAECQRNRLTLVEMRHNTVKEFHTLFAVHQQLVRTIAPPDLLL